MDVDTPVVEPDANYGGLGVNSMVEVNFADGKSYGAIRWIGYLPGRGEIMAGVELVISTEIFLFRFRTIWCLPGSKFNV